jgi:hypothetical protein
VRARAGRFGPAAVVGIALLAFAGAFLLVRWWDFTLPALGGARYQAVFLANGQTYFGTYRDRIGPYAKVESVYYIQQTPREGEAAESRVVRRGGELHAPLSGLLVPKSAILFIEDLRDDSPVVRFIEEDRRR